MQRDFLPSIGYQVASQDITRMMKEEVTKHFFKKNRGSVKIIGNTDMDISTPLPASTSTPILESETISSLNKNNNDSELSSMEDVDQITTSSTLSVGSVNINADTNNDTNNDNDNDNYNKNDNIDQISQSSPDPNEKLKKMTTAFQMILEVRDTICVYIM